METTTNFNFSNKSAIFLILPKLRRLNHQRAHLTPYEHPWDPPTAEKWMKTDPHDHSQKISIFGCQTGRHFGFLATAGAEEKILRPQLKNLKQSTA